jgi:hypothetical protein
MECQAISFAEYWDPTGVACVFRDRPAVLGRQRRQQPGHEVPDPAPGLGPGETRLDRVHQRFGQLRPSLNIYSVAAATAAF